MKHLVRLSLFTASVAAIAAPASANVLTSAIVSGDCTSYTITVAGTELDACGTVEFELTLTPTSGTPELVSGSINVCPETDRTFSASATNPWGPFSNVEFTILGESWLFVGDNEEAYRTVQFSAAGEIEPDPSWNGDRAFLTCADTAPEDEGCTLTQGYWKTHPEDWPVSSITLGGVTYTVAQAITILKTPPRGDATYILAVQLIAAMLNAESGADSSEVGATIAAANAWLASNPLGSNPRNGARATGLGYATTLDSFNNGDIGPGHCD